MLKKLQMLQMHNLPKNNLNNNMQLVSKYKLYTAYHKEN